MTYLTSENFIPTQWEDTFLMHHVQNPVMKIQERFRSTQNWFVAQTSILPYIAGHQIRQTLDVLPKKYPDHLLVQSAGFLIEKEGRKGWFIANADEEIHSAEKLLMDPDAIKELLRHFDEAEKVFFAFLKQADKDALYEDTFKQHDFYEEFLRLYDDVFVPGLALDGFVLVGEQIAQRILSEHPQAKEDVMLLVHPQKLTFFEKEERDLIEIALKMLHKKVPVTSLLNDEKFRSLLEEHQQKYYWTESSYKHARALPMGAFIHRITDLLGEPKEVLQKRLDTLKHLQKERKQRAERIKKSSKLPKHDVDQLLLLGQIASYLDRRKAVGLMGNFYIDRHLHFLCEEHSLVYGYVSFLLPWELEQIMAGEKKLEDFSIAGRRRKAVYFRDTTQQEFFITDSSVEDAWGYVFPETEKDILELQGTCGFPGILTGRARIVHDPHTVEDFHEGDILITGMTRPDFISLVRKSSAIITDEGGIISHAGILSRELEKPCVLGTKFATRVIKDGEMLHVDATNGVVKRA